MATIEQAAARQEPRKIPATMMAAVYRGRNDVRLETVPVPEIGPGELLLRVHSCGICGTDLKKIATGSHSAPRIFGHETSGVVAGIGSRVSQFELGDRVVVFHHLPCGNCFYCHHKTFAQCDTYKKVGCTAGFEPSGGGFAEYVRVMDWIVQQGTVRIAPGVSFEQACFVEPVNTCLKGIETLKLQPGETVLVIGQGPIGMILGVLAKRTGATVVTTDLYAGRLTISKQLGLVQTIDASAHRPCDSSAGADRRPWSRRCHFGSRGQRSDPVCHGCGASRWPGTTVCANRARGIHDRPGRSLRRRENAIGFVQRFGRASGTVGRLFVMDQEMDLATLISHKFPLSRSIEALHLAAHPQPDSMKIVIQPGSSWEGS